MIRVPPGRAGRQWLRHRVDTARNAAELLKRKLLILEQRHHHLWTRARECRESWELAARQARQWVDRAVLTGGLRGLRLSAPRESAEVTLTWDTVMGTRYPVATSCAPPRTPPGATVLTGAVWTEANVAHRRALEAAVDCAAAAEALRIVELEIATTRRRVRALDHRWIPGLEATLSELDASLEELERAEHLTRHWASGQDPSR
ncbi:V-type ATP synthase subunit D [Stackebrandtia nassauensis]|uniref:H+transporting two-sector ATPase D subunit n=1 Tax=Stackebrandtia nassauensis (strain DSM 44728 / CIP 108903 / NRRL B-16338 / NBRC 102104 / LLR-40K-21) TaxID=446470 RepID=D3PVL4_STANL|nr:V-type ATP synthase subunit D [Stackebrandtia nassauensis]ADD43128.1 H+transporting two-sector ATPase D subunit [Stackebrandtia nassauensis DSM 44728]